MKKTTILGITALLVVGMFFSTAIVNAHREDYPGTRANEERHKAMENAFKSGDYNAWYQLMTEDGRHPHIVDVITKDNFDKFAQAHEAVMNGNHERAMELRHQLGLGYGCGNMRGMGRR